MKSLHPASKIRKRKSRSSSVITTLANQRHPIRIRHLMNQPKSMSWSRSLTIIKIVTVTRMRMTMRKDTIRRRYQSKVSISEQNWTHRAFHHILRSRSRRNVGDWQPNSIHCARKYLTLPCWLAYVMKVSFPACARITTRLISTAVQWSLVASHRTSPKITSRRELHRSLAQIEVKFF